LAQRVERMSDSGESLSLNEGAINLLIREPKDVAERAGDLTELALSGQSSLSKRMSVFCLNGDVCGRRTGLEIPALKSIAISGDYLPIGLGAAQ
jgi:hypothetical protein